MIEIRELPSQEFDRLKGFADGFCPDAGHSVALVAENNDEFVGRIFLVAPCHIEGPHVEPHYRGGTVFKRLVVAAEMKARAEGIKTLMAYAADPTMENYIKRLGYSKMPFTVWFKDLSS